MNAAIPTIGNPFPGLRPFHADENHLFFGRESQSHELLNKLHDSRFVTVVGTSGSGKSSLVRAGLLPALHGGFMVDAGSGWRIGVMRPGHDPIGNLARVLNSNAVFGRTRAQVVDQVAITEVTLRRSDLGLVEATRQARLEEHVNLLVVVDQFEELFRFAATTGRADFEDDAAAFVNLLIEGARSQKESIFVILTMRSDFLGDCSRFRNLPEMINDGQYLVPRMDRQQRRAAIAGPVAVGGGEMAPRLLQRLLNDVGDDPDHLPIMQHALMRTWDHWAGVRTNGETVDLEHYEHIGGMASALSQHADEAYESLPDDRSREIAAAIFKTVSERGADNREIRRPTRLGLLCEIARCDMREAINVIDAFRRRGRSFLMPPPGTALTEDTLIDVSHESLIRNWQRLKDWVDDESTSARIYRRLAETAALFEDGKAGHWRDPDLQIALDWRERTQPNAAWAQLYDPNFDRAMAFLDASKASNEAEVEEREAAEKRELLQAQALAEEQRKAAKRLRITLILLSVVLLAALAAVFAFYRQQLAEERADVAVRDQQLAEQERARADSTAAELAILYGQADSLRQIAASSAASERTARIDAVQQRELAVAARDTATFERERARQQARLAETLRDQAVAARDTALFSQQRVQAVALATKSLRLQQQGRDTLAALLALEALRFDDLSGRQFRNEVYDALRQSLNAVSDYAGGPTVTTAATQLMTAVAFNTATGRAATGGADGAVSVLAPGQPGSETRLGAHQGVVTALAFSGNGAVLASGAVDQIVRLWDPGRPTNQPTELRGHRSRIWSLAVDSEGARVVSGSTDGEIRLWMPGAQPTRPGVNGHTGSVLALAFDVTGERFASAGADSLVLLWNSTGTSLTAPSDTLRPQAEPRALAFDPNGGLLVAGAADGSVHIFSIPQSRHTILGGFQGPVNTIAFSPDGSRLAAGSSDNSILIWHLNQLDADAIVLTEHASSIRAIAFSAGGDMLYAGTFGNQIAVWNVTAGFLADELRTRVSRVLTRKEWQDFVGAENAYPYE